MPDDNVGLPGFVKGMERLNKDLGNLKMSELIQPAIDIAEEGFKVDNSLHGRLEAAQYRMPISELPHLYPGGTPVNPGVEIKQEQLAGTLKAIRDGGADSFYNDQLGQNFLAQTSGHTEQDLTQYEVKTAAPAKGSFAGYDVLTAPPPFGGTTLIQTLNMVEDIGLEKATANDEQYIHLLGEVIKRSYSDRLGTISDPEFNPINVDELTSDAYAEKLASDISMENLSEEYEINDSPADEADHNNTTHFVIVDKEGNMASTTNTLSNFFGSGKFVDGYFLNNQLSNFSETPGSVNAPEPGKSPRSYTAPTILAKDGQPFMGIGTPGGKRIPMMIADVLTRHLLLDQPLKDVVEAPRFYVEEEEVIMEEAFADNLDEDTKAKLQAQGYRLDTYNSDQFYGAIHSLVINRDKEMMYGASDSRRAGDWQIKEN
ncbi:gamma-glutamyltransferase family protein [Halobacillus andaensis]|uniref:gamma-glutamyltransferase family protein n=1 Tax=Halobacillus andaensis TaxID=1176239 RepID=UPI003D71AC21